MPREIQLDLYQQFAEADAREKAKALATENVKNVENTEKPKEAESAEEAWENSKAAQTLKEIKDRIKKKIELEKKATEEKLIKEKTPSLEEISDDIEPFSPAEEYYGRWEKNRMKKVASPKLDQKNNRFKYYAR